MSQYNRFLEIFLTTRYPEQRQAVDADSENAGKRSTSTMPNFYSESLCRKQCIGHQRRYREPGKSMNRFLSQDFNRLIFLIQ